MSFVYSEAFYLKSSLFAAGVLFALQGKVVGNHGDAFAIGGLMCLTAHEGGTVCSMKYVG